MLNRVIGHTKVKSIFKKMDSRLPNSMIFTGLKGVGKFLMAKELIKLELCENKSGCGDCGSCLRVEKEAHENILIIKPTGAMIKIDASREVINYLSFKKDEQKRFVLIDDADLLNPQASNALLKIIEDPPRDTHFILISHNLNLLLSTIKSRSQIYRFGVLSEEEMRSLVTGDAWIYKASGGRVDLAKSLSDPSAEKLKKLAMNLLLDVSRVGVKFDLVQSLTAAVDGKEDLRMLCMYWLQLVRDIFVIDSHPNEVLHQDLSPELAELASKIQSSQLQQLFSNCLKLERDLNRNIDKNLSIEHFLQPLCGV